MPLGHQATFETILLEKMTLCTLATLCIEAILLAFVKPTGNALNRS
jgi:hypothetical protein